MVNRRFDDGVINEHIFARQVSTVSCLPPSAAIPQAFVPYLRGMF